MQNRIFRSRTNCKTVFLESRKTWLKTLPTTLSKTRRKCPERQFTSISERRTNVCINPRNQVRKFKNDEERGIQWSETWNQWCFLELQHKPQSSWVSKTSARHSKVFHFSSGKQNFDFYLCFCKCTLGIVNFFLSGTKMKKLRNQYRTNVLKFCTSF